MLYTFREPNLFTFRVNFSQIASIFTFFYLFFSVNIVSHLAALSHIAAFSHLRVPQSSNAPRSVHVQKWRSNAPHTVHMHTGVRVQRTTQCARAGVEVETHQSVHMCTSGAYNAQVGV